MFYNSLEVCCRRWCSFLFVGFFTAVIYSPRFGLRPHGRGRLRRNSLRNSWLAFTAFPRAPLGSARGQPPFNGTCRRAPLPPWPGPRFEGTTCQEHSKGSGPCDLAAVHFRTWGPETCLLNASYSSSPRLTGRCASGEDRCLGPVLRYTRNRACSRPPHANAVPREHGARLRAFICLLLLTRSASPEQTNNIFRSHTGECYTICQHILHRQSNPNYVVCHLPRTEEVQK